MLKLRKNITAARELLPAKNLRSSVSFLFKARWAEGGDSARRANRAQNQFGFLSNTHRRFRTAPPEVLKLPLPPFCYIIFSKISLSNPRDTRCPPHQV